MRSFTKKISGKKWFAEILIPDDDQFEIGCELRHGDLTSETRPSVERVQNISSSLKKDALPKRILRSHRNIHHVLKFTKEEDHFLKEGITMHGFGQWTVIFRDYDFQFQDGRTVNSLKKRAGMKMQLA